MLLNENCNNKNIKVKGFEKIILFDNIVYFLENI